jgi:N-acetylglucosamine kinase-like BadF-type ATPase
VSPQIVLAVDGGNSKTHLALADTSGAVLALVRGPLSSPHHIGLSGAIGTLEDLLRRALSEAGMSDERPVADLAELWMAGIDFPSEEDELRDAFHERGWTRRTVVGNDTFAVLRAGTDEGWGVAVTCGSGINCVGVARDGRHARFPSLGTITGDWGGGYDVGLAAVAAAARSEDGRGSQTTLEQAVPRYFGLEAPHELAEAIHRNEIAQRRVEELAPTVFAEAAHDDVARSIVEQLASEVVALARVAMQRLDLGRERTEVVLGGGLLQSGNGVLHAAIERDLRDVAPAATARVASAPPIVGATLLGLDELGADADARARLHEELTEAVMRLDGRGGTANG